VPGAIKDAEAFLENIPETRQRIHQVFDLVDGFETPFGLELLSTVHWVVTKMKANSIDDVIKKTYAWNDRKKKFSERQITVAHEVLRSKSWLNSASQNQHH